MTLPIGGSPPMHCLGPDLSLFEKHFDSVRGPTGFGLCLLFAIFLFSAEASASTKGSSVFRWEGSAKGRLILGGEGGLIATEEDWAQVILLWGDVEIQGKVGELKVLSGKALFLPGSVLRDKIVLMGGSYEAQGNAQVAPEKIEYQSPGLAWRALQREIQSGWAGLGGIFQGIFWFFAILLSWIFFRIFFALFPKIAQKGGQDLLKNFLANGFSAVMGLTLLFLGALVLVISLVGILFLPVYVIFFLFLWFLSYGLAALWLGHKVAAPRKGKSVRGLGLFLGLLALQVGWAVPFPFFFGFISILSLLAFGSLLRVVRGRA